MVKLPTMLNKIYLVAFVVLLLLMSLLTWWAGSWLHSIGSPESVREGYFSSSGVGWMVLWASFIVLLVIANVVLWTTRKAWAVWLSFLYFALFIFLRYWWLEGDYLDFARRHSLTDSNFSTGPLVAAILVVGVGILIFFDQFIVLRLSEKMHPTSGSSNEKQDGLNAENAESAEKEEA
jgi:hypothetical protein